MNDRILNYVLRLINEVDNISYQHQYSMHPGSHNRIFARCNSAYETFVTSKYGLLLSQTLWTAGLENIRNQSLETKSYCSMLVSTSFFMNIYIALFKATADKIEAILTYLLMTICNYMWLNQRTAYSALNSRATTTHKVIFPSYSLCILQYRNFFGTTDLMRFRQTRQVDGNEKSYELKFTTVPSPIGFDFSLSSTGRSGHCLISPQPMWSLLDQSLITKGNSNTECGQQSCYQNQKQNFPLLAVHIG